MNKFEPTLPAVPEVYRAAAPVIDAEFEREPVHIPLAHYLWILRRHGWKIAGFVAATMIVTLIVSLRLTPIYESTSTVDIDRQMPTGVLGKEAVEAVSNDADQFLATQVKLIESDSVLRPVVDKFRLREVEKDALEEAPDKSALSLEAPIVLKQLRVARPPNTYILQISYRSPNRQLAADVANSIAQSYLAHTYRIRYKATQGLGEFMERQLEELRAKMEKSSAALLQFERELNVINPEEKTSILSSRLLQLNTEFTNAQADRVRKESAYNSVKDGTLAAAQVSTQGEALKKLTEALDEAQQRFAEAKTHYGLNHPEYKKAESRVNEIQAQIENTQASINASFQNSSIRVADEARPGLKPVFPRIWLNVLLAFLFATFLGVGGAVLSDVLDNTVRDPDQVMRLMNTDVVGSLPAVKDWRRRLSPIQAFSALDGHAANGNGHSNGVHRTTPSALIPAAKLEDQALTNYEEAI